MFDDVEFTSCSAIHITVGDTQRRPAFIYHDRNDEFRNGDMIIWGEELPKNQEEFDELILKLQNNECECSSYSADWVGVIYT